MTDLQQHIWATLLVIARVMRQNQYECFGIEERRANILHAMRHSVL
ncbi:MAG: hypothetical protein RMM08_08740 [Armatimonadota bacterium]|nr:hypothetical protein [bacterium]MDW8321437.1 hypothetical protein [Armatimonadota bacterium]